MVALTVTMEILIVRTVPHIDAFIDVFCGMRMNDIDNDFDSVLMGLIDKLLEFMRLTES